MDNHQHAPTDTPPEPQIATDAAVCAPPPPTIVSPEKRNIPESEMENVLSRLLGEEPKEQTEMAQSNEFDTDIVVIGSGPGGYVAAIRAAQLGARAVCIERESVEWGGTCLNWGCIPTKTMIASVERLNHVKHAAAFGVLINGEVGFDFGKMMERKTKVVTTLRGGVQQLLKTNHVRSIVGTGKIVDAHTVAVTMADGGTETIKTANIVIATGSVPFIPPIPGLARDPKDARGASSNGIWTSDEAVAATDCPKRMLIVGSGAVGLEFSFVFRALGVEVTVVEIAPEILPLADKDISIELRRSLKKQGINILTDAKLTNVEHTASGRVATLETKTGTQTLEVDVILVGAGRKPLTDGLGLESVGVEVARQGIVVNDYLQTTVPSIYAIGDVTGKAPLAHAASHMGIVAVENAMGHQIKMDYKAIPAPIYTVPEVAWVGLTEDQAREQGYDVVTGKFPFRPLGRAMALGETEGLVKVVAERKYGELLGVHIVGAFATELIHEGVIAIKLEATVDELISNIHAHPTLSEAIGEAAMDTKGESIHTMRK